MTDRYVGATRDELSRHAAEGWDLANHRTDELRKAVDALRAAEHLILGWGHRFSVDPTENVNFKVVMEVLKWGKKMFPEEGDSLNDIAAEEDARLEDMEKDGAE